jgi:hypothetical protein
MIKSANFVCLSGHANEPAELRLQAGQTCLHAPTSMFFRQDHAGHAQVSLPPVTALRVASGAQLVHYGIRHEAGGITHWIKFVAGGECFASFDLFGEFQQLHGVGLTIVRRAGELIVGPCEIAAAATA